MRLGLSMLFPNPLTIQKLPHGLSVPLVFIHDGGGTAFQYFFLGDIGRDFYGISNPRFESGCRWDGGIPEMAAEYLKLIGNHFPGRDIILGGWSLGGLVALEIYHQLAGVPTFNVIGLVMIDSPFPPSRWTEDYEVDEDDIEFDTTTKPQMREKVTRSLREARQMIRDWDVPVWQGHNAIGCSELDLAKDHQDGSKGGADSRSGIIPTLVPVVLLKAVDQVPSRRGRPELPFLGWDQCTQRVVKEMYEIPGHHFSVFKSQNIDACTSALREVCDRLVKRNVSSEVSSDILISRNSGDTTS